MAVEVPRGPLVAGPVRGRVVEFDEPGGYGTVSADDPAGSWFFHCTAIADGTRTIEVGTDVVFDVRAGHQGRFEAVDLRQA